MRASTLFGITVAILLGLAAIVGARYYGLFQTRTVTAKQEILKVLVAKVNLFEGMTVASAKDTHVRPLTAEELDWYRANKDKLMPPVVEAAQMRVLTKNVEANQILLKEHFQDQALPEKLSARLQPGMRTVQLVLPKERAAGGLVKVGEKVDVLLTTTIFEGKSKSGGTATANLARDLRVVVKRDNLWTVLQPVPQDKPVSFTLEANPYRAALIEFARHVGEITIVPAAGKDGVGKADGKELLEETARVTAFLNGELAVGERDLERLFHLQPRATKEPPPFSVEMYSGTKKLKGFTEPYSGADDPGNFSFHMPGSVRFGAQASSITARNCPTCKQ